MVIRRVNLAAYPQVIQVEAGDIIRATTEFDYIGPALSGTLYTALWRSIWFDPHDEIANKSKAFSLPDSPEPGNHISIYVDIIFPQGYPEGLHYGLYSKIMGVPGEPRTPYYDKIIELVAVAPPEQYSLEISIEPPDTGYVTREPPDVTYPAGSRVRLTAQPYDETKYKFDHWGGDISGTTNPIDITMNKDMWVVAAFKSIEKYTIDGITVPEGAGYWYLEPYKELYERLDVVKITAFANVGYGFDYWLVNGSKAAYNPASVIVMRDVWIECHFRRIS